MKELEQGRIAGKELMFLIFAFIMGTSLLINPGNLIGHDAWLTVLAGLGEGLFFVGLYLILAYRFKGKNLIEINNLVFGPFLGKCISLLYLGYFLLLGSLVLRNFGDFFVNTIYQETPLIVIVLGLAIVAAFAVYKGLEVIARLGMLLVVVSVIFSIFDTFLMLPIMDFTNVLPFFDVPLAQFFFISHATATFPFGEIIVFLLFLPFVREKEKVAGRVVASVILAGLYLSFIVLRNVLVLGEVASLQTYPFLLAIRLINLGRVLTRMEIIILAAVVFFGFLKLTVLYYGSTLGLAHVLGLRSYRPLLYPLGLLIVVLSIVLFANSVEMFKMAFEKYPYYAPFFQVGLPLLSLVVALIRGVRVEN